MRVAFFTFFCVPAFVYLRVVAFLFDMEFEDSLELEIDGEETSDD